MTDDILARIAECIGTQRDLRNVRTVGVLEAAQARIAELGLILSVVEGKRTSQEQRAEVAEAEAARYRAFIQRLTLPGKPTNPVEQHIAALARDIVAAEREPSE
jgi:hypothetical protein